MQLPGFFDRIARHLLAGPIEAHDPSFPVQHDDQRAHGIENRRHDIALLLQRLLRLLEFRDVEPHPVNEPGLAVVAPDQPGFTMKPDHPSIPRHDAIRRSQRLPGEKHFRGFIAPAALVVGMDLLIPANRIFQPFLLRKAERGFDLRTHIGFADTLIQIRHEHDRGNLIEQDPVSGFEVRSWILATARSQRRHPEKPERTHWQDSARIALSVCRCRPGPCSSIDPGVRASWAPCSAMPG